MKYTFFKIINEGIVRYPNNNTSNYYTNEVVSICLWFNRNKTTEPISMKCCTEMAYIPGSDRYISVSVPYCTPWWPFK